MVLRFNPAPGWPLPSPDFVPPEVWRPDPTWPSAPEGWPLVVDVPARPAAAQEWVVTGPVGAAPAAASLPRTPAITRERVCLFCGRSPALATTIRAHRGMLVLMQFRSLKGEFCRDCGLALTRKYSADTLLEGWWGPFSSLITPVILLLNAVLLARFRRLPAPDGDVRRSVGDRNRTLLRRPQMAVLALPVLLVAVVVAAVVSDETSPAGSPAGTSSDVSVGTCFDADLNSDDVSPINPISCDEPHTAEIFGLKTLTQDELPSESRLVGLAETVCGNAAQTYFAADGPLSSPSSGLEVYYYAPDQASWASGQRVLECAVVATSGELTASLRRSEG